jgi:hypothetical protein
MIILLPPVQLETKMVYLKHFVGRKLMFFSVKMKH